MTENEKQTNIEVGKKLVESQINTDLNKVKYNEYFNAFIVSDIIPTKEYFEYRLDQTDKSIVAFRTDIDRRFEQVDKRFEQVDKRFEQVDKRFDVTDRSIVALRTDMDRRFDKIDDKFDKLYHLLENRDIEMRGEIREQRKFTLKMFMISISISVLGVFGILLKTMGILGK